MRGKTGFNSELYRLCWHWSAGLSFIFLIYKMEMKLGLPHRTVAGHVAVNSSQSKQSSYYYPDLCAIHILTQGKQQSSSLVLRFHRKNWNHGRMNIGSGYQSPNSSQLVLECLLLAGCTALQLLLSVRKRKRKGKKIPKVEDQLYRELWVNKAVQEWLWNDPKFLSDSQQRLHLPQWQGGLYIYDQPLPSKRTPLPSHLSRIFSVQFLDRQLRDQVGQVTTKY